MGKRSRSASPPARCAASAEPRCERAAEPSTPPRTRAGAAAAGVSSGGRAGHWKSPPPPLPFHEASFAAAVARGVAPLPFPSAGARLAALLRYLDAPDCRILVERASMADGYPGEYTAAAYARMLAFLRARCGASAAAGSRLLDIGSGAGKPVFAAALSGAFASAAGIELNANREMCTWLAARYGVRNAAFFRGDAGVALPPVDATHIYSFNKTFPPAELARIARCLNAAPAWRYMLSSLDARGWAAHGLRGVADVATIAGLPMAGSGRRYAMFVVARGAQALAEALASEAGDKAGDEAAGGGGGGGDVLELAGDSEEDAAEAAAAKAAALPPPRIRRRVMDGRAGMR